MLIHDFTFLLGLYPHDFMSSLYIASPALSDNIACLEDRDEWRSLPVFRSHQVLGSLMRSDAEAQDALLETLAASCAQDNKNITFTLLFRWFYRTGVLHCLNVDVSPLGLSAPLALLVTTMTIGGTVD